MIHFYDGTIFNAPAIAIVNTVNTTGAMGAGIALEFSLRYPEMYEDYLEKCKNNDINIGKISYFHTDEKIIVNFPTKMHFKYPSKIEWIEAGLKNFVDTYKENGITSVAFPKLGTLNGKLEWINVKKLMEKYLSEVEADVYICLDILNDAEGKEKEMLDFFNNYDINELAYELKLKDNHKEYLISKMPYKRFWQIGKDKPIKGAVYKRIFNHFYHYTPPKQSLSKQINLFDM